MQKNLFQYSVRGALTAAVLCTLIGSTASAGSFTRGCAARDMQLLMLIEERESTNAISAQELSDAMLTMLHARLVCHEGRVLDGLALYDDVARNLSGAIPIARWEK